MSFGVVTKTCIQLIRKYGLNMESNFFTISLMTLILWRKFDNSRAMFGITSEERTRRDSCIFIIKCMQLVGLWPSQVNIFESYR